MTAEKEHAFQVPNLERGLLILEYMKENDRQLCISEIARALDYPANSVMRIMNALTHHGYTLRDPATKGFSLSNKMMRMGSGRAQHQNLMEQSLDVMRSIRDETGETVVISVMSQGEGIILDQIQGIHPFRFVCEPGTRQAIHASASTKAILAFMADTERDPILAGIQFERLTDATIMSLGAFRKELREISRTGYAFDRAEALEGVHCAAAPILNAGGDPVASVTVTGPAYRMPLNTLEQTGSIVRDYTKRISKRFGYEQNDQ